MKLSIVTTLYFSEKFIQEFYKRIIATSEKITKDFELIFVNDGSPDNTLKILLELVKQDKRIKIINFSRNFGHHKAMMTGLKYASGDNVFLIDSDLEEDPEILYNFWQILTQNIEFDVIYGVQETRKGSLFEKISGKLFYKLFNYLSDIKISENLVTARLMRAKYVRELLKFEESELCLAGIWAAVGFKQKSEKIKKHNTSKTTYSFSKKTTMLFNAITSFTNRPLILIFNIGLIITVFSAIAILYLVINKLVLGVSILGWTSLMASLWFLGGCVLFSIGLVGIYISKIFIETKKRPYVVISDLVNFDRKND